MQRLDSFDFGELSFESDSMQVLPFTAKSTDFKFPLTDTRLNFAVLRSDGLLSHRWGARVNKKGDAYVYCRDIPGAEKVSLHASGEQHISIASEPSVRVVGLDRRYSNVWTEPEFESEAIATFSLLFPPWAAGLRADQRKMRTKDEVVIVGHREKVVVVGFFIVDSAKTMRGRMPHFVLGQLPLRPGTTLHIIAWKEPENDLLNQVRSILRQPSVSAGELEMEEGEYTLWVGGYRAPNSAYMMSVPVRYTPSSGDIWRS